MFDARQISQISRHLQGPKSRSDACDCAAVIEHVSAPSLQIHSFCFPGFWYRLGRRLVKTNLGFVVFLERLNALNQPLFLSGPRGWVFAFRSAFLLPVLDRVQAV